MSRRGGWKNEGQARLICAQDPKSLSWWRRPAVSAKLLDAATRPAERFSEHLSAAGGALGQSRAGLLRRAVRAIQLWWNLQVRSCQPDPLGADIVHVREDRRNRAGFAGRFGSPGARVKMFDKNLVYAIVGGKDLDCGSAELSVNLILTRGHGSRLPDLGYLHSPRLPAISNLLLRDRDSGLEAVFACRERCEVPSKPH